MFENFIYVKDNALEKTTCEEMIGEFNRFLSAGSNRKYFEFGDRDTSVSMERTDCTLEIPRTLGEYFSKVQECIFTGLDDYAKVVEPVRQQCLTSNTCKIQMTPISGGFHRWHCEHGSGLNATRSLAWMIYLNDVDNGGETEFLYQHLKVKPKAGSLVIWPAGVTHPHRGNPPYSNEKYILTGWFDVQVSQEVAMGLSAIQK